ncbi:DNA primase family protein [Vagococcus fluvialis]|uniref:DNA primase family protein n=1 Tax=Vagococcus fluvialis TaxID=2738 RepID=UPI003B5CF1C6
MIYTSQGFITKNMVQVDTSQSDWEYLTTYEPVKMLYEDLEQVEQFKKSQAEYFLSGEMKLNTVNNQFERSNKNLLGKRIIALDYDDIDMLLTKFIHTIKEKLQGIDYMLYPTIRNNFDGYGLRYRLLINTDRLYSEPEAKTLLTNVINHIGIKCDSASKTFSQPMGLPLINAFSSEQMIKINHGVPLKIDDYLTPLEAKEPVTLNYQKSELSDSEYIDLFNQYVKRNASNLSDYSFYLNAYMCLKHGVQSNEISQEIAEVGLMVLAGDDVEWQKNNVNHFRQDKAVSRLRKPVKEYFGSRIKKEAIHIGVELAEIINRVNEISNDDEKIKFLKLEAEKLNDNTPSWFWCKPKIEKNAQGKLKSIELVDGYNHVNMGNLLIKKYNLVRYPKLIEGAVYDHNKGYWRYFGKNEMKDFVESETLEELQKWGYYDIKHITPTRIYTIQKTYDKSYPSKTPFETSKPELVVFKNGTYNILTDTMKENDPADYILNAHNYNLDMTDKKTPHINALLDGMVGENSIFLKQFIGYMFYRSYQPAQEMVFLKGNGGEGKSTLLNFISEHIIGEDNISSMTPHELSQDKFALADLLGKSVNISADIKDDYIGDSSVLKRLTGNDTIRAQYKGIQGFMMKSYAKFIFSANKLPRFKDVSDGFFDRLVVIPFINGSQRKSSATFWDNHDMDKIIAEAHSFAYHCIKEFRKVFDGRKAMFTKPESLTRATQRWFVDNDHLAEFLLEATEIHLGDDRGEIASTVHKEWQAFCAENGYQPKSSQEVRQYLEGKGIDKKKTRKGFNDGDSNQWRYISLELKTTFLNVP